MERPPRQRRVGLPHPDQRTGPAGQAVRLPEQGRGEAAADARQRAARTCRTDDATRARIGDMIAAAKRGAPLPAVEDVRRRLGLGLDPASAGVTFGEAWHGLAGRQEAAAPVLAPSGWTQIGRTGCCLPRPMCRGAAERRARGRGVRPDRADQRRRSPPGRATSRSYVHVDGDVRSRPRRSASPPSTGCTRRCGSSATSSCAGPTGWRSTRSTRSSWRRRSRPRRSGGAPAQARAFLAATADDPLGLLFRIVLLRGARRGEAVGLRWSDADLDAGYVRVRRPILLIGADVTESRPKSTAGERLIWLDAGTVGCCASTARPSSPPGSGLAGRGRTTT